MKYYLLAGFVVVAGVVAVYLSQTQKTPVSEVEEYASKRMLVETETKVRPAHFADMKWQEGAEVRAPASKKK